MKTLLTNLKGLLVGLLAAGVLIAFFYFVSEILRNLK